MGDFPMNKFDNYDNFNNNDNDGYMDYYDTSHNNTESRGQEAINGIFGFMCFSLIATHCFMSLCKAWDNRYSERYRIFEYERIRGENIRIQRIILERKKKIKEETKIQKYDSSLLILDSVCSICLDNFEEDENISTLKCNHSFHNKCIEMWLDTNFTCPMCRLSL